jgi:hypothetical protein
LKTGKKSGSVNAFSGKLSTLLLKPKFFATTLAATCLALTLGSRAVLAQPKPSSAEKQACADSSEQAQDLKKARKLLEAKSAAQKCAKQVCPKAIQQDCSTLLEDLQRSVPSIVIQIDSAIQLTPKAFLDGRQLTDAELTSAIEVNPGKHTVRLEAGAFSEEQIVLTTEGERGKAARFKPTASATSAPTNTTAPGTTSPGPGSGAGSIATPPAEGKRSVGPFVLGGVGVASLIASGVFLGLGYSQFQALKDSACGLARTCGDADISPIRTKYTLSYVFAGVGGAAVLGAVIWYILDTPKSSGASQKKPFQVGFGPAASGVGLATFGTF